MRVLLLLNPKARRGDQFESELVSTFEAAGCEVVRGKLDHSDGGAEVMMRCKGQVDCVAVGGGDGTLISALRGVLKCGLPLGVIPLGTFNDLARTLGIPTDPVEAARVIAGGKLRAIDVGQTGSAGNEKYYVNESSIGVSTRIARLQTPEVKKRYGFFGVAWTTLTALRYSRPFAVTVRFDGREERFRTLQLTVANSHHFGGLLTNEEAAVDDGMLDLYSLEIDHWFQVLPLISDIVRKRIANSPHVRARRASSFDIQTRVPHHVYADGEPAGFTPAHFEVLHHAIQVFVP